MLNKRGAPWGQRNRIKDCQGRIAQTVEAIGPQGRRTAKIMGQHIGAAKVEFLKKGGKHIVLNSQ